MNTEYNRDLELENEIEEIIQSSNKIWFMKIEHNKVVYKPFNAKEVNKFIKQGYVVVDTEDLLYNLT